LSTFFDSVHTDPWAPEFIDLASLNVRATDSVEEAVERVRRTARSEARALRSTSIVILGPPGAGKTHLFARLRRKLGPRGVFVLVRPLVHAEMTPRFVLGEIVRQLGFSAPRGLSQTSALVGSLLGRLDGVGPGFPSTVLAEYAELPPGERAERLATAIERLLAIWPEVDEAYLARLLQVPFAPTPTARALLAWLSGADCDESQLERIGATASLGDTRAIAALRTLAAACAMGAPIVLVFDQLENLMDASGAGLRLRAYANLASEYVDTMRGSVLVHLALDSEWDRGIEPTFNLAQRSRIVMRRELLALPKSLEREALLKLYYQQVRKPKAAFPWPLGAARVERLCQDPGYTPRMLLTEFRDALEAKCDEVVAALESPPREPAAASVEVPSSSAPASPAPASPAPEPAPRHAPDQRDIASEWLGRLRSAREAVRVASDDRVPLHAARLADGVLALGRFASGLVITAKARPPAQLSLEAGGELERIAILQESNHRSLSAVLARLTRLTEQSNVVVLREGARALPASWAETLTRQAQLLATERARWIDIDAEDCARILALSSFLQAARSGDVTDSRGQPVTEAEVTEWVEVTLDVGNWPLARDLAGASDDSEAEVSDLEHTNVTESFIKELDPGRRELPTERLTALPTLQKLRVASFERLVREVLRIDPEATRASVLAELDAAGENVRWLGRSIVFLREHE
jgi:AAA ATPase domain